MTQIQEAIVNRINILPVAEQEKVLEYIESRINVSSHTTPQKSLGGMLKDCLAGVPDEILETLPADLSQNFDQYMFGDRDK